MDLKELLGEDLAKQVTEKLGDKKLLLDDGNVIPKHRFDEVNEERKMYKDSVDSYKSQIEELKSKSSSVEDLQAKLKQLNEDFSIKESEYQKNLEQTKFNYSLDIAIKDSKVKNPKAVKALLDMDKIKLDGSNLLGLTEQIESLKTSDSYLFDLETKLKTDDGSHKAKVKTDEKKTTEEKLQGLYKDA